MKEQPGKGIFFKNKEGEYSLHSMEEVLGRRINSWKGWRCSAGIDNIHITADGNIYSGTCRVGGLLGNIFDSGVSFPEEWQICTKNNCMCGVEMRILKSRTDSIMKIMQTDFKKYSEVAVEPDWVGPSNLNLHNIYPINISWDIGRRCNFECSYCPPSTANNFEAHKSFGSLKYAVEVLLRDFTKGRGAKWIFTGGEPTLNPAYLDIVKYIHSKSHTVHTQSNGSRGPDYFSELIEFSTIGFSVHFDQFVEKRFYENCEAILATKLSNDIAKSRWFGVRLMVPPGFYEKAMEVKLKLLSLDGAIGLSGISLCPLYKRENVDELQEYSATELELINAN